MAAPRTSAPVAQRFDGRTGVAVVPKASVAPAHEPKFTADAVADPKTLARQQTRAMRAVLDQTRAARSNPHNSEQTWEDVALGTAGAKVTIRHGFGRRVRWAIVRWKSTAGGSGHSVEESSQSSDGNVLTLASYVAGTADIAVWGQQ